MERKRIISFSPPDISELEIAEVAETLRSGWITTGPRTKLLERRLAAYIETGRTDVDTDKDEAEKGKWSNRLVCLNSATAAEEMNLRLLGVGPGDEVIVPAYSYTATASAAIHCGAKVVFVDIQNKGLPEQNIGPLAGDDRQSFLITFRAADDHAAGVGRRQGRYHLNHHQEGQQARRDFLHCTLHR